ncbi:MAG: polysaccharide deacetylase family protein [Candidatus Omnitrophica bacterium]|nr:polysaccharide deacetylase family protein [Candidatus Omnitrophota bacterium]MDD5351835.1 polysaccharide deacetylase family protein [Candidatus Omnitrophota bacterium]MDD5550661.1 polysaccharide deacetylase family protein [Candidatus Omnitrophota bacterium]
MPFRIVKAISVTLIILLSLALIFGLFLRTKYIAPVLMYHYVVDTPEVKSDKRIVTPNTFDKQMHFLKVNNYNVISLEEFAGLIKQNKEMPKNTVVITFDDGHLDNYKNAYPILKKYGLKATMFVISDYLSKPNFLTEGQIKEMSDSGLITIGSHTLTEQYLPHIGDEVMLKKEIYDSKRKLEEILNKPVNCFSYPIGGFNKKIRQMVVDAGYTLAVATSPGLNYPNNDTFVIKRVRISENSKNLFIFWFETSGFYKYLLELRKNYENPRNKNDGSES